MTKIFNEISYLPEFDRDMKRLLKKFRTLEDDLKTFIEKALYLYHKLKIDNRGIVQIPGLGIDNPKIYKSRKFACRSLKGTGSQSGIRIIYAYFENEDKIEFIEIYYKGEQEIEDRSRIKKNYRK
jgi:hypothetical protein